MGRNEANLQVLRELADKATKQLSIIFEKTWQSDLCLQPRKPMESWALSKGVLPVD